MEVSSHALAQQRVQDLSFAVAVLTNLGRDHLDYHASLAHYAAAKKRLFSEHNPRACVLNLDDAFGRQLAAELGEQTIGYSCAPSLGGGLSQYYIQALRIIPDTQGQRIELRSSWGEGLLQSGLLGRFNASNLLAALGTLMALGVAWDSALRCLSQVHNAPGRMERLGRAQAQPLAVVDYAHTPQALEQALTALREHSQSRLWCVFGCGGDRDPGKRSLMGEIAERLADKVVITSDNPRTEDPVAITAQIRAGLRDPQAASVIQDRAQAIHWALAQARAGDIVLVAGKGHEDYQIIGTERQAFDDRAVICAALRELAA
jgi:UDP-N-acetylmuramoyl-L-alanyl-D-glutamate--2,6-diaminopimelate ligase